jgi:hypothetical protein
MRVVGDLMYLSEIPDDRQDPAVRDPARPPWTILGWAYECYKHMKHTIKNSEAFWDYFDKEWIPKMSMWITGNRHIPHAGQDTNAAIESYHSTMKSVLRASWGKLVGRRVDWLISQLTGDVINRYEFDDFRKENGFVTNKKERAIVFNAIVRARSIPDD